MQEKDITQKMLERYNDVFSDILNVLLFKGERLVSEYTLKDIKTDSVLKIDGKVRFQDRDVAKYWKNSRINIALFGLENQTSPDRLMPLRIISYDGAEYAKQSRHKYRYIKKYPVVTLVLYLGYDGKWTCPKNLLGLLEIDEKLKPYVSDYKINVFEIAYLDRETIDAFRSDFWILADYLYQMRVNGKYFADNKSIDHIEELLMLMSVMTGDKRFEEIIDEVNEKEANNMCEVLDIVEARGIEKGIGEGREKGVKVISRLNTILAKEGNLENIIRANTDKVYQNELLKKYDLLKDFD